MANKTITNKHLSDRLDCIEKRLPNGELKEMHENIKEIKEILFDPDDGIIVKINRLITFKGTMIKAL